MSQGTEFGFGLLQEEISNLIPFNFSFGHGAAKRKTSDSFLLVLKTDDGKIGIGEGLPRSYVTGETLNSSARK